MLETILGFKALILAALIAGAYLYWRREHVRKHRNPPQATYECPDCNEKDCDCHRVDPPE